MKKFTLSDKMSYSKKVLLKSKLHLVLIYSISVFSGLAVVGAFSLAAIHFHNAKGKGGAENINLSELTQETVNENSEELNKNLELVSYLNSEQNGEIQENQNKVSYFSYRVKKGDMIGFIADEFNVSTDTIISVNSIKSSRLIQIGQYLKIPSMTGILYTVRTGNETPSTIAQKYKIDAQKCALVNNLEADTNLKEGSTIFVPDAELDWVTRQEINGDLFIKPIHSSRYYFSSWYGWRNNPFDSSKRTFHGGIDMACATGTTVYPALAGTVTQTGNNAVYGNFIIVSHHSGYKTLYGHLSKIDCKKGNFVYTNTPIGKVGSTGKSTGPHLHFAVYKQGRSVNPANLWK